MIEHNELWAEAEELAELLAECEEITAFKMAEQAMKANPAASNMIGKLQDLQQEVAEFQARNVPPKHFVHLLQETESLMAELENIQEVKAFHAAQSAVNELLQSVTSRLAKAVVERVTPQE